MVTYNNHFNECGVSCQDYTYCHNYGYGDHYNCNDGFLGWYMNDGCWDHVNETKYANHHDGTGKNVSEKYSIEGINASTTNNWEKLGDAVEDLKKLRDAVIEMPKYRTTAGGQPINGDALPLTNQANKDEQFGAGQKAQATQFNETLGNIKKLWQAIKDEQGSDWPEESQSGSKMKKEDYKKLMKKIDTLARLDQRRHYKNHYDENRKNI